MLIPQSSGSGIPADALGNLGDRYFDTAAQRWYLKRWVANREGVGDSILFPINLFPSVGDFEFSTLVRRDNQIDDFFLFGATSPDGGKVFHFRIDPTNKPQILLRNGADSAAQYVVTSSSAIDGNWRRIGAKRVGSALTLTVDGSIVGTIADTSGWTPSLTQTGTYILRANASSAVPIKSCEVKFTGPGGSIIAPFNEGTGTTISNQAGANGTLTDETPMNFWYQAWVPMDLL